MSAMRRMNNCLNRNRRYDTGTQHQARINSRHEVFSTLCAREGLDTAIQGVCPVDPYAKDGFGRTTAADVSGT